MNDVEAQLARIHPGKIAAVCALVFALMFGVLVTAQPDSLQRALQGHNDFALLYVGAKLVGTPELYSVEANQREQIRWTGAKAEPELFYVRPPLYAALLTPLALLPYRAAYAVFQAINVICTFVCLVWLARRSMEVVLFAGISVPILFALVQGQDVGFYLFAYTGSYLLLEQGRPRRAGLLLSMCLIKFHLLPLTVLALFLRREWRAVQGFLLGSILWVALSFATQGPTWPMEYWAALQSPIVNPGTKLMPNLHGLTALLGFGGGLEVVLAIAVIVGFVLVGWWSEDRTLIFAVAIISGLLLSVHAYTQDAAVLLIAFGLISGLVRDGPFGQMLRLGMIPVPYVLLFFQNYGSALLVLLLLAAVVYAVVIASRRGAITTLISYPPATTRH